MEHKPMTPLKCSNEITITVAVTNKKYYYSNNEEIFIISKYIYVYAGHSVDKKYRLLIDHTFCNGSSNVDIYDCDF